MHHKTLSLLTSAFMLLVGSVAHSAPMTKPEYKARQNQIAAQYTTERKACDVLGGNAKDVCVEQAKGNEKIAEAQLEAGYHPSDKNQFNVRMAKADAAFEVDKEKCDDSAGNAKDVCLKEAKSAHVTAKANAKVIETTLDAKAEANAKTAEAVKDANTEKRFAEFGVAKEKCEVLAGDSKDECINSAKLKFAQP